MKKDWLFIRLRYYSNNTPFVFPCFVFGVFLLFSVYLSAQPIPISSISDLQKIGNDPDYPLDGSYILTDDIDATSTSSWNNGQGFQPIGSAINPFTGEFNGNGKKIIGLYINRTTQNVGLFSVTNNVAKIYNLTIINPTVTTSGFGGVAMGAIVGTNDGLIEDCHVIGGIVNATISAGAICGSNNISGVIRGCTASATISATLSSAGGLVGGNNGLIEACSAGGNVSAINNRAGGLVGYQTGGTIRNSFSSASVSSGENVGGLVGELNNSMIIDSYAVNGQISGTKSVGGLVGRATATAPTYVVIRGCYTINNVRGKENVGGVVGIINNAKIEYSYSKSAINIISPPGTAIGGVCGRNEQATVSYSFAKVTITGTGNRVGGIVGYNYNNSLVERCYSGSSINVVGDDVGGGVGRNEVGEIRESLSREISVTGTNNVGGFLGHNFQGRVFDSYSWAEVSGTQYVGGFVGYNIGVSSQMRRCYSIGRVVGDTNIGGFSSFDLNNTIVDSYWDIDTSGLSNSWGGTGKTDAEMMQQSTFVNWDFTNIWTIQENQTYPYLRWEMNIVPNLLGLSVEEAQSILSSIGLGLGEIVEECSDQIPITGQVMYQSLEPGIIFQAGSTIDIKVSSGRCTPFVVSLDVPGEIIGRRRGESLEMRVIVQGNIGDVSYQWYFEPLNELKVGTPIPGETDDTLFIQSVDYIHAGYYWCEVSDQYDTIQTPRVQVYVVSEIPVMGWIGLSLLTLLLAILSTLVIFRMANINQRV